MAIDLNGFGAGGIGEPGKIGSAPSARSLQSTSRTDGPSFADVFSNAIGGVENLQAEADLSIRRLATGEVNNLHEVMVAFEQARLSMQLMVEVRNRLVETYQEVSRMPL